MDATVFCFVARELAIRIRGMRVEKVFSPLPDVWTFGLGRAGHLVLFTGKPSPFLFLSPHKPENPAHPSGQTMWLRKRLRNRRVLELVSDWPRRRFALELSPGEGQWLILDLTAPPRLTDELPAEFGTEPIWPELERITSEAELWRSHPHLTPHLRRFLSALPRDEAAQFLESFTAGMVKDFYCVQDHKGHQQVRLWSLPGGTAYSSALEAVEAAHADDLGRLVRAQLGTDAAMGRAARRLERAMVRLASDRARLEGMVQRQQEGLLLQNHLHGLDKNARLGTVRVVDRDGGDVDLALEPELTVRENMTRLFVRGAKGQRGLGIVETRQRALQRELDDLRSGRAPLPPVAGRREESPASHPLPARFRKIKVFVFRSSDGFLIVRGRNAQANHQLLTQAASPFDYWLHAQDGPGAHVIIKRDHATQVVPERTIHEAACLAALASHLKMADRGEVLLCLVKNVRTIKGAALGMVEVGAVLRSVRPVIEPDLEARLRLPDGP